MLFPKQNDLNWSVRTESVVSQSGIEIPNKKVIIRDDTNDYLSICGSDYYPYQNSELIDLLDKVSNRIGLPIVRSGFFGNGEKVFLQLKGDDLKLGNDKVEGYLTGINSYDGSTSLSFGVSNITISCQNTFFGSYRELDTKVRHTKNMVIRVDDILRRIEGVQHEEKVMFENIVKLSENGFNQQIKERVIRDLFNIKKEISLNDIENIPTITRNKMSQFYVDLNGEISQKGDNLWGLFSGVTKYTTHSVGKGDNSEKKMFGTTERSLGGIERRIFSDLVELV
jgi:Domain of unknown function (DUF932)